MYISSVFGAFQLSKTAFEVFWSYKQMRVHETSPDRAPLTTNYVTQIKLFTV